MFSKKVSSGYTQYFNLMNNRSGFLFQGRTKIIPVKSDEHYLYLPYYIFSNPIKLVDAEWKEKGVKDKKHTLDFLKKYKWSSFSKTVLNEKNVCSDIVNDNLFFELFDTSRERFKKEFMEWLG